MRRPPISACGASQTVRAMLPVCTRCYRRRWWGDLLLLLFLGTDSANALPTPPLLPRELQTAAASPSMPSPQSPSTAVFAVKDATARQMHVHIYVGRGALIGIDDGKWTAMSVQFTTGTITAVEMSHGRQISMQYALGFFQASDLTGQGLQWPNGHAAVVTFEPGTDMSAVQIDFSSLNTYVIQFEDHLCVAEDRWPCDTSTTYFGSDDGGLQPAVVAFSGNVSAGQATAYEIYVFAEAPWVLQVSIGFTQRHLINTYPDRQSNPGRSLPAPIKLFALRCALRRPPLSMTSLRLPYAYLTLTLRVRLPCTLTVRLPPRAALGLGTPILPSRLMTLTPSARTPSYAPRAAARTAHMHAPLDPALTVAQPQTSFVPTPKSNPLVAATRTGPLVCTPHHHSLSPHPHTLNSLPHDNLSPPRHVRVRDTLCTAGSAAIEI